MTQQPGLSLPKLRRPIMQHRRVPWRALLLLTVTLCLCQPTHSSSSSPWAPHGHSQHWRKMLQLVYSDSSSTPYNGSAILSTYPSLNSTGASLRKLLPGVSGYVHKSGPAEMLSWSQKPHYAVAREAVFLDWRQRELTNPAPQLYAGQELTCAAARHPPVPFHHCHVFVNHQYKVAYIRSPKSASTSIMNWMGQCRYNKTRNWNSTTCLNYSWERFHTPEQIASIWKDYFFFGFIRNPWARAYSLYKDMTATNHFLHKHGPRCQMEWGRFCREPFTEFDRLYGSGCSHKPPHYAYWHMMDQYHCMITPTGQWAVDFLGRVERGNEDWKVVVDEMNKRRLPGVPEVQWSDLEHTHRVEPGQRPPGVPPAPGYAEPLQQPAQLAQQQAEQQQQQQPQQPGRPVHTRHRQMLGGDEQEQEGPHKHEQPEPEQQSQVVRMFRHLWRRIRLATASANEEDAEADGEIEDFVAGGAAGAAGGSQDNPDPEGLMGPYTGANEHCVDAVSQWFACDIERFGYLPSLAPSAAGDAAAAAATAAEGAAAAGTAAAGAQQQQLSSDIVQELT